MILTCIEIGFVKNKVYFIQSKMLFPSWSSLFVGKLSATKLFDSFNKTITCMEVSDQVFDSVVLHKFSVMQKNNWKLTSSFGDKLSSILNSFSQGCLPSPENNVCFYYFILMCSTVPVCDGFLYCLVTFMLSPLKRHHLRFQFLTKSRNMHISL